jgi:hypothetical protein
MQVGHGCSSFVRASFVRASFVRASFVRASFVRASFVRASFVRASFVEPSFVKLRSSSRPAFGGGGLGRSLVRACLPGVACPARVIITINHHRLPHPVATHAARTVTGCTVSLRCPGFKVARQAFRVNTWQVPRSRSRFSTRIATARLRTVGSA